MVHLMLMDRVRVQFGAVRCAMMRLGWAALRQTRLVYLRARTVTTATTTLRLPRRGVFRFPVREFIGQQSAEKRTFKSRNSRKNRHLTLRKLIEIGPTAKWRSRNLRLSIRQF